MENKAGTVKGSNAGEGSANKAAENKFVREFTRKHQPFSFLRSEAEQKADEVAEKHRARVRAEREKAAAFGRRVALDGGYGRRRKTSKARKTRKTRSKRKMNKLK